MAWLPCGVVKDSLGALALVAASVLALLTGCSGSAAQGQSTRQAAATTVPAPEAQSESGEQLTLTTVPLESGALLVTDHRGYAVYGNRQETPEELQCVDAECTASWIPLAPRHCAVGPALDLDQYAVVSRPDGSEQVTYDGVALYVWSGDGAVGVPAGDGVAGIWFAVSVES